MLQSPPGSETTTSEFLIDRYRELLEAAPGAMVLVNQDGEIVLLNLQWEKQFGYRRDELVVPEQEEHSWLLLSNPRQSKITLLLSNSGKR